MSRAALYSFLATMIVSGNAYALDPPFDARPFNFQGPAFIGTDIRPGVLTLDFDTLITDGEGDDFALLTSSLVWGPFAEDALIQFFFSDKLQGSILTKLAPDQLFSFDLPGEDIRVVDRILVINISPDPPGFSNDAVMTIVDAGVPPREVVQVQFNIQPDECPNRIISPTDPASCARRSWDGRLRCHRSRRQHSGAGRTGARSILRQGRNERRKSRWTAMTKAKETVKGTWCWSSRATASAAC